MKNFDLLNLQLQDSTELHLLNPVSGMPMYADDAETKPLVIVLYGKSSKQHRQWLTAAIRKNDAESRKKKSKTADELIEESAEYYAVMTAAMKNMSIGDVELNSKDAYKALYSNPALDWIFTQVSEKLGDTEAFLQK